MTANESQIINALCIHAYWQESLKDETCDWTLCECAESCKEGSHKVNFEVFKEELIGTTEHLG